MVIPARAKVLEMRSFASTPERQPSDTAMLSCSECGHVGRINGDWLIDILDDSLNYECSQCETAINSRRDQRELTDKSSGSLRFEGRN
jgi:DNA-directed RNA polymerase subunit RPC12/RpoP